MQENLSYVSVLPKVAHCADLMPYLGRYFPSLLPSDSSRKVKGKLKFQGHMARHTPPILRHCPSHP